MAEPKQDLALVPAQPAKSVARVVTNFNPTTFEDACRWAKMIANSDLAPKDYRGKPGNVMVAIQMGAEIGLAPMQALQNIACINGRPSLWGDAALAIVQIHPAYESHKEWTDGEGDMLTAYCEVKRKGQEPHRAAFSVADAKKAGLWGKAPSPWQTYPKRMLAMRARGFALRDKFADAMRGLILAEEAMDIPVVTSRTAPETATLDVNKQLASLSESTEPNRGHGQEGMERQPEAEPAKEAAAAPITETPAETAAETAPAVEPVRPSLSRGVINVIKIDSKMTKAKGEKKPQEYKVLTCQDGENRELVYVWDQGLFPELALGSYDVELRRKDEGDKQSYALHRIIAKIVPPVPTGPEVETPSAAELFDKR